MSAHTHPEQINTSTILIASIFCSSSLHFLKINTPPLCESAVLWPSCCLCVCVCECICVCVCVCLSVCVSDYRFHPQTIADDQVTAASLETLSWHSEEGGRRRKKRKMLSSQGSEVIFYPLPTLLHLNRPSEWRERLKCARSQTASMSLMYF